jgi:hypothetical protein
VLIALLAALSLPGTAAALVSTRYVSLSGSDAPPCSSAAPCRHVAYAIGQALTGDTISIGPGTFDEGGLVAGTTLNFIGAGPGTAGSFDATHNTLIQNTTTSSSTIKATASASFSNLRLEGHVSGFGPSQEAFSALDVQASAGSALTSTVANVVASEPKVSGPGASLRPVVNLESVSKGTIAATITGLSATGPGSAVGVAQTEGTINLNLSNSTLTSRGESSSNAALQLNEGSAQVSNTSVTGATIGFEINGAGRLAARNSSFTGGNDGVKARLNASGKGTAEVSLRDSLAAAVAGPTFGANAGVLLLSEAGAGSLVKLESTNSTLAAYGKEARAGLKLESLKAGASSAVIRNTIAYAVDPTPSGPARDILASGPATVTAESSGYSTVISAFGATITPPGSGTNVIGDPAFAGPATGNFTLGAASPLLRRGNLALMEAGELDLAGNPHVESECGVILNPDIGAFELVRAFSCPTPGAPSGGKPVLVGAIRVPLIGIPSISAPRRAHHPGRARAGKLTFNLSEAATVTVALKRLTTGHLRKRACVARAKACGRRVTVAVMHIAGRSGKNTVTFATLKLLRRLKAGRYEVVLLAVNPQHVSSAARTLKFSLR